MVVVTVAALGEAESGVLQTVHGLSRGKGFRWCCIGEIAKSASDIAGC